MHVAVIIDGNRRFAKKQGKKPWQGHEAGSEVVEKFLDWCKELDIKETTIYCLSIENLKRDKTELDYFFKIFKKFFNKFKKDKRVRENQVKIRFIGNLDLVPKDIKEMAEEIEKETENYNNYIINFCFSYGGRQELIQAFNKLKNKKQEITEEDIKNSLWLNSEPDIIIRTGARIRTSNFLPFQSIYSEWFFLDKLWPEFTKQDLQDCIEQFKTRKRNFGK